METLAIFVPSSSPNSMVRISGFRAPSTITSLYFTLVTWNESKSTISIVGFWQVVRSTAAMLIKNHFFILLTIYNRN